MRLADFIYHNQEEILQEWEDFAASLIPINQDFDKSTLRDHVKQMLATISVDLANPETEHEEIKKSRGHENPAEGEKTAAAIHGKDRLALGFSLDSAVAEYRALRASVTRLFQKSLPNKPILDTAIGDTIRFNEAIDQAITESVTSYSFEKEQQTRVFDTVLSSLPDISFALTLACQFSYVNKAMTDLFAFPLDKFIGKTFIDIGLFAGPELQRHVELVVRSKKRFHGEMSHTPSAGKREFYE